MKSSDLLKKLSMLGFQLFETGQPQDVNATLAEVVETKELRLWEGFPVLLANAAKNGLFNYEEVVRALKKSSNKSYLDSLVVMSLALYKVLNLKFFWADKFYKTLSAERKKEFKVFLKKFSKDGNFDLGRYVMSSQKLKTVFTNYFNQEEKDFDNLFVMKKQYGLEYALSQVFSPKQKELFLKKLKREKLTKTEKEYFSRSVKKKVFALANPELHQLSRRLLENL